MPDENQILTHPSRETAQPASPGFWAWFKKNEPKGTVIIAVIAVLVNIAHIVAAAVNLVNEIWFPAVCHAVHFAVIVLLFIYSFRITPLTSPAFKGASAASKEFERYFQILLVCWAALYGVLTIRSYTSVEDRTALVTQACQVKHSTGASAANARALGWAEKDATSLAHALRLADRYKPRCKAQNRNQHSPLVEALERFEEQEKTAGLGPWEYLIALLNVGQSVPLFFLFWLMDSPCKDGRKIVAMLMVVVIITVSAIMLNAIVSGALEYLGSLFGAIAFALWVGRFSSVYLRVPVTMIVCLYLYAIIQLSGATFKQEDDYFLIAAELMMLLKVLTVYVCAWLLKTGRLLYYFEELRLLDGLDETSPLSGRSVDDRCREFMRSVFQTLEPVAGRGAVAVGPVELLSPETRLPVPAAAGRRLSVDIHREDLHIEGDPADLQKLVEGQLARSGGIGGLHRQRDLVQRTGQVEGDFHGGKTVHGSAEAVAGDDRGIKEAAGDPGAPVDSTAQSGVRAPGGASDC
jgi:hypothetical protein